MYVILTQDVPQVGTKNSLLDVSEGYFMNFLSPRNMAQPATSEMIESLKDQILEQKEIAEKQASSDYQHAQMLKGAELSMSGSASDKGTLFQALTKKDVAAAIKNTFKFAIAESDIIMDHLKKVGEHAIAVQCGDEMVEMKVQVEAAG